MNVPWIEAATFVVAFVGVVGGLYALRQANRQRRLDLGSLYLQRYWEIDDDLLQLDKGTLEHNHARHRYLRLCEDELEAAHRGWLERSQWEAWHDWVASVVAQPRLVADLEVCDQGHERFEYLRACLQGEPGHLWALCPSRVVIEGSMRNGR